MATKKETVEETHENLMSDIEKAELALSAAKAAYKTYCIKNPLTAPKQPTVHELRVMAEKNAKKAK